MRLYLTYVDNISIFSINAWWLTIGRQTASVQLSNEAANNIIIIFIKPWLIWFINYYALRRNLLLWVLIWLFRHNIEYVTIPLSYEPTRQSEVYWFINITSNEKFRCSACDIKSIIKHSNVQVERVVISFKSLPLNFN